MTPVNLDVTYTSFYSTRRVHSAYFCFSKGEMYDANMSRNALVSRPMLSTYTFLT